MAAIARLKDLCNMYKLWIKNNPQKANEAEMAFKFVTYFLSGRVSSSAIPTEIAYALSNLIVLLNDRIIQSSTPSSGGSEDKIRVLLTTLEYCEVIFEIGAQRLWGTKMKWLTVGVMQTLKATMRFTLLLKYNQRFISSPAINPLNREIVLANDTLREPGNSYLSFELKKSGRVVRKVEASPISTKNRAWESIGCSSKSDSTLDKKKYQDQIFGESLHILRPLAHLYAIKKFGNESWKPWVLSLVMDLASLQLLKTGSEGKITRQQRSVYSKRVFILIMYIMRSPFYENYSEDRVTSFLNALSRMVPLAKYFVEPTKSYIPFFQSTYSYVWST